MILFKVKTLLAIVLSTILLGFSLSTAYAENYFTNIVNDTNFYIGVGAGTATVDVDGLNFGNGTSLDDRDSTFKIFAGADFNDFLGLEVAYANLGTVIINVPDGGTIGYDGAPASASIASYNSTTGTTFSIAPTVGYQVNEWFRPYVKLGVHSWKQDAYITIAGTRRELDKDGRDIFWGLGLQFKLPDIPIGIRAEFENYSIDHDTVKSFTLGASLYF